MLCKPKTKILFALFTCAILLSVCVCAFAANTVSITSAQTGAGTALSDTAESAPEIASEDKITVNLSTQAGTNVTILVIDASINLSTEDVNASDIIYINQQKLGSASSSHSFTFSLPENISSGTYAVYVGGDGVNTPAAKYFKIPSDSSEPSVPDTPDEPTETITYISGDFDKDGKADLVDAIYILRYIKASTAQSNAYDVTAGDVNLDGFITSDDAKYIMHYVLGITLPEGVSVGQQLSVDIPTSN